MLENILLVISVLLIAIVLLQGNKASDAGGIITGGNDNLFQHQKERGLTVTGQPSFVFSFADRCPERSGTIPDPHPPPNP